ncbi:hypothetical protein EVAR_61682_1 [Eumeta japonica]|uniref:Uncharacterized protein n=1 Tax=Eumeta variegata TaxID=151549 RepID=A0A4C1ZZN2_EUMVA|nr:hypothetical protein EVAR_61682_1 [Eumeta japonica]
MPYSTGASNVGKTRILGGMRSNQRNRSHLPGRPSAARESQRDDISKNQLAENSFETLLAPRRLGDLY